MLRFRFSGLCLTCVLALFGCGGPSTYRAATGESIAYSDIDRHYETLLKGALGGVVEPEIKFERFVRPGLGFRPKSGEMRIGAQIDARSGFFSNVRVISNASDEKSAEMLVEAIAKWKLKPFTRNGSDAPITVIFPIRVR